MPRVTVVQVVYNSKKYIPRVFESIFNQTFRDFNVVAVISGNSDGSKEYLQERFPQVEIIDPGYNIGFAKGHNLVFAKYDSEFFQLVNPDLILEPTYIENIIKPFADEKVGAATGKLYKIPNDKFQISNEEFRKQKNQFRVIDTTGVIISKSGRGRDRGQHEEDEGQYDSDRNVLAVSGAGAMYRRSALEAVKLPNGLESSPSPLAPSFEYFDEDFHSYWEDVDLGWRMASTGLKNVYIPAAVGYHGRGAGSSPGGYKKVFSFIKFHRGIPNNIRRLNYKNHIFMYIKNSRHFYPQFFVRELAIFFYVLIFEISTLKVLPEMFKLLPKMWKKRQIIMKMS